MNGEERGEADKQGQRPAGPGAPEGHRCRHHRDHPAQQARDERNRDRVAEDIVLVVVLDGVGDHGLLGGREVVGVVDEDARPEPDRHLVRGVEDEKGDEGDAAHGRRAALESSQQQKDGERHQRGEEEKRRVHGEPGAGVVADALVDAVLAARWVEPEHDR